MQIFMIIAVLFSLAVAIFALQNSEIVTIRFLIWELPSVPQVLVILWAALAGMATAFFFGLSRHYRLTKQSKELKKQVYNLEQELIKIKPVKVEAIKEEVK